MWRLRGSHLATLCRKHFAGFGAITIIPASMKGQPQIYGGSIGPSGQLSSPGPDCRTPLIIVMVYTASYASVPLELGFFFPGRLILQHASVVNFIMRHTHQPARPSCGQVGLRQRGHTSCIV